MDDRDKPITYNDIVRNPNPPRIWRPGDMPEGEPLTLEKIKKGIRKAPEYFK